MQSCIHVYICNLPTCCIPFFSRFDPSSSSVTLHNSYYALRFIWKMTKTAIDRSIATIPGAISSSHIMKRFLAEPSGFVCAMPRTTTSMRTKTCPTWLTKDAAAITVPTKVFAAQTCNDQDDDDLAKTKYPWLSVK